MDRWAVVCGSMCSSFGSLSHTKTHAIRELSFFVLTFTFSLHIAENLRNSHHHEKWSENAVLKHILSLIDRTGEKFALLKIHDGMSEVKYVLKKFWKPWDFFWNYNTWLNKVSKRSPMRKYFPVGETFCDFIRSSIVNSLLCELDRIFCVWKHFLTVANIVKISRSMCVDSAPIQRISHIDFHFAKLCSGACRISDNSNGWRVSSRLYKTRDSFGRRYD